MNSLQQIELDELEVDVNTASAIKKIYKNAINQRSLKIRSCFKYFDNITDMAEYTGLTRQTIRNAIK